MKILNIPIEPLEERYSIQWDTWFKDAFEQTKFETITIYGDNATGKIVSGSFLDVVNTNEYKTSQLLKILEYLKGYDGKEPLVLFFHDLWFPGLVNIAYVADGMGFDNLYITGCLHAGSYDEYDFLNKKGMTPWAQYFEKMIFKVVDFVFVATEFHRKLILKKIGTADPRQVIVTGFPFKVFPEPEQIVPKENIVVFPHRLDSEKQPDMFDRVAKAARRTGWKFIKSKEVCKTKAEYYQLLAKSKIAISCALQETWGIAMQEAVMYGCLPLVPNRLSYVEMYNEDFIYYDEKNLVQILNTAMDFFDMAQTKVINFKVIVLKNTIRMNGNSAIFNMITMLSNFKEIEENDRKKKRRY